MKRICVLLSILALVSLSSFAQNEPNLEIGFKPFGSYDGSDIDSVSLTNGNLTLHIPMPYHYPQRGGRLDSKSFVVSNTKTFSVQTRVNEQGTTNYWAAARWVPGTTASGDTLSPVLARTYESVSSSDGNSDITRVSDSDYSLTNWDGSQHPMRSVTAGPGVLESLETVDATGWHVDLTQADDQGVPKSGTLFDRLGNKYDISFGGGQCTTSITTVGSETTVRVTCHQPSLSNSVVDGNGNTYNFAGPDTLGRPIPSSTGLTFTPTSSDTSACLSTGGLPLVGSDTISYTGPNGTPENIKLCFANLNIQTEFGVSGVLEYPSSAIQPTPGPLPVIVSVINPDSSTWLLTYDSYGNITNLKLPLGGNIAYEWETVAFPSCSSTSVSRAVAKRTVTDNNGNTFSSSYRWVTQQTNATQANGTFTNISTDALNNDTVHVFTDLNNCAFYETSTQIFQGAYGGTEQKQVDTTYQVLGSGTQAGQTYVLPTAIQTTVFPSKKVSLVTKQYDSGHGNIFGNLISEKYYDWGTNGPGALLREEDNVYQWQKDSRYLSANMLDLVASSSTVDPVAANNTKSNCPIDAAGTTKACIAETDSTYDESAYLSNSNILVQHTNPAPGQVRGNLTSSSRWLNTGAAIVSHANWYDTGEIAQQIDPLNNATTHSYDPAYAGGYSTQTCRPTTNGVAHCVSGTYDFSTGLLTSFSNENATAQSSGNTPGDSAHTSFYAYDLMSRMTSATFPPDPDNGGAQAQTTLAYPVPISLPFTVTKTKSVAPGIVDSITTKFDGLGRPYQTLHGLPGGTAEVDTTYDGLDHVTRVTNPYFSISDPTYGTVQSQYDALGRVTSITEQDGSIKSVAYDVSPIQSAPGDCTTSKDEAGNQRTTCSDALGRLIEVHEPGDTFSGTASSGAFNITGPLPSQSGVGAVGATSATGSVTILGHDQGTTTITRLNPCPPVPLSCFKSTSFYDSGGVTATIAGHAYTASFRSTASVGASDLAQAIINQMTNDPNVTVLGKTDSDGQSTINLQARTPGTVGNLPISTSYSNDATHFPTPSFTTSPTSGSLTGGTDSNPGVTVYDQGNVSATVGGFTATVPYSQTGNNSAPLVASALASALSVPSSPVTASSSGAQLIVTYKNVGSSGNTSINVTSQSTQTQWTFPPNAFSGSGSLINGFNVEGPSVDFNYFVTQYAYDGLGNLQQVTQKGDTSVTNSSQWRVRNFTYDSLSRLLTATNPESGTISYGYDADGNLLQKTSPAPNQTGAATQTVSYCYDSLNRLTGKGYGGQSCPLGTPAVSYAYDSGANAKGKLTSLSDQAGSASYGYDVLGRLAAETRTLTGTGGVQVSKNLSYEYNLDGSLAKLHYPSGAVVTYTPGAAGLTLSAVDTGNSINYVNGATYGPDSGLTGFVSGNSTGLAGVANAYSYNKRLQPVNMSASSPSQTLYSIGYDFHVGNGDNGNVWGITNYKDTTHDQDQAFTYDSLNRLTSAQNAGTDCSQMTVNGKTKYWGNSYVYDAWGNVLQKNITKCGAENLQVTADAHNWIHASGTDYQYDSAGNMTFDATANLHYNFDQENRISGAGGSTYTYDGDGNRVIKFSGTTGTLYWYMTPGIVAESDLSGNTTSEYVFFAGERVARKDFSGGTTSVAYYFSDHLKTASVITDAAGNIKAESDYYPWGGELQLSNNDSNHYKFTGKERDIESGLDYFGARYYRSGMGRFLSSDWSAKPQTVPYADLADPQSLNLYSYVNSNPLSRVDSSGHDWFSIDNKWQWQKGHTAHDANGKALKVKGYQYLLKFTKTGVNKDGGVVGKLTLFDQDKQALSVPAFSGGLDAGHGSLSAGQYMINLSQKSTLDLSGIIKTGPGSLDWETRPTSGVQFIPPAIQAPDGTGLDFRWEWGDVRMALNPLPGEQSSAYFNNYLHGKERPGDYTHNCICDRSEHMINTILGLAASHVPVQVQ